MAHLDVKKVGRIPDGGGWRVHGRDSDQHRCAARAKSAGAKRGYVYLHAIVDGFSRLAHTEPLPDEKGKTTAAFLARAKVWFAAHGITHIHRIVTDNGACYRSGGVDELCERADVSLRASRQGRRLPQLQYFSRGLLPAVVAGELGLRLSA